jgi:hypothetical protein
VTDERAYFVGPTNQNMTEAELLELGRKLFDKITADKLKDQFQETSDEPRTNST